jgi:predicted phosphoribosyltransferase
MIMYFESRAVAGAKLASELINQYRFADTAVLALDQGGVAVGYQIAIYLHSTLRRLLTEPVRIEDEGLDFAMVLPGGAVAPSPDMSESEYQYYYGEYAGQLDEMLREASSRINRELGADEISPENMRGRNVILVSDGLNRSTILDAAMTWLKPARVEKVILACPIISVNALDRAHILVDELHILGVTPNFISTEHYYDINDAPDKKTAASMIDATILGWK